MDIEKINVLVQSIDVGSFSAAADSLGYTISGISRSVFSLEEQFGFPLLIRGKHGVEPTSECEQLLPLFRELLHTYQRLHQSADRISGLETGSVIVGTAYPPYHKRLAELIVSFRQLHPGIHLQLVEGTSSELQKMLMSKQLDLCIISRRDHIPVFYPLCKDRICIWVPDDHPSVHDGCYHLSDLSTDDYILIHPDKETDNSILLDHYKIHPNICASTSDVDAAYAMVQAGLGITLMNEILAKERTGNVTALPLDYDTEFDIGLAALDKPNRSPAAQEFISFLRDRLK